MKSATRHMGKGLSGENLRRPFFLNISLSICVLLTFTSAQAQINTLIDSLEYELNQVEIDTSKIDLIGELSYEYAVIDADMAISYAERGLRLAKHIEDERRTVSMLNHLGTGYYMRGDYTLAIEKYEAAIALDKQYDGDYYPRGMNNLSMAHRNLGNYDLSAKAIYAALEYNETNGLDKSSMSNYNNLGALFRLTADFGKALESYHKARELASKLDDTGFLEYVYHNIGVVFSKQGLNEVAITYYDSALEISTKLGHDPRNILSSLGYDHMALGNYEKSRKFLLEALRLSEQTKDKNLKAVVLNNLGNLEIIDMNYDQAINHALTSLQLSEEIKNAERKRLALKVLEEAYTKSRDFELAHHYLNLLKSHEDSLLRRDRLNTISTLEAKYETEKKEQQIANLKLAKSSAETRRNLYLVGLIGVVLVSAFTVFWLRYRIRKNRQLKEREVLQYKAELNSYTTRLVEKSTRIEELNHELEKVKEEISDGCPAYNGVLDSLMQSTILTHDEWAEFKKLFSQVHPGFFGKIRMKYPDLTETEERLMTLTKLNLSSKEIAAMLGISVESVNKSRYRLRKKLDLKTEEMEQIIADI